MHCDPSSVLALQPNAKQHPASKKRDLVGHYTVNLDQPRRTECQPCGHIPSPGVWWLAHPAREVLPKLPFPDVAAQNVTNNSQNPAPRDTAAGPLALGGFSNPGSLKAVISGKPDERAQLQKGQQEDSGTSVPPS